jgi:hypothetical protein
MTARKWFVLALLAVLGAGSCICVERPRRMTDDERAKLKAQILTAPPANMQHHVGADLDGRLELLGYDLDVERDDQGRIVPGRALNVTWYWKCKEPLEEGWRLFTHVTDDTGTNRVPGDELGLVRKHYPPNLWRAGEIIADQQQLMVPADFNSRNLTLFVGAWFGPHRLPIRNDAPHDDSGRVRIGPLPVRYDLPSAAVPQTSSLLTIDGRLDEPVWQVAVELSPFVRAPDGPAAADRVRARLLWSRQYLYIGFDVRDPLLVSQFTQRDDPIYTQDAVEVFLDEDGDGKDYYEFEVSPSGVLFDVALSEPRKGEPGAYTAAEFRAAVVPDGTVNDDVPDRGYTVEIQIPFVALAKFKQRPPAIGSTWRANFYVLDMVGLPEPGVQAPAQEGFAWSAPRKPDFHEYRRFGELTFGGPVAEPAPPPPPPPAPLPDPAVAPTDPAVAPTDPAVAPTDPAVAPAPAPAAPPPAGDPAAAVAPAPQVGPRPALRPLAQPVLEPAAPPATP